MMDVYSEGSEWLSLKVQTGCTGGITCFSSRNGTDEIVSKTSCMVVQDWTRTLKQKFLSVDLAEAYLKLQQTRGYDLVQIGKECILTLQNHLCNVCFL